MGRILDAPKWPVIDPAPGFGKTGIQQAGSHVPMHQRFFSAAFLVAKFGGQFSTAQQCWLLPDLE